MQRRDYFLLLPAVLAVLLGVCLWVVWGQWEPRPLDKEAQAGIIRQVAEQPSSWRGWELLHRPSPDWTDPRLADQAVRPVAQPLSPPEPFFLVDGSRGLTPEAAAREAIHGMLHYIRANSAGEGYQLLDFKVGEPRLLNREEIIQRALARCGTRELNKRTEAQLRAWCRGFFHRYPGLGEDMWMVEPAFSVKWSGEIASVPMRPASGAAWPTGTALWISPPVPLSRPLQPPAAHPPGAPVPPPARRGLLRPV